MSTTVCPSLPKRNDMLTVCNLPEMLRCRRCFVAPSIRLQPDSAQWPCWRSHQAC
jgi:hypothetical protein